MVLFIKNKNVLMASFMTLSFLSLHNTAHSSFIPPDDESDNIEQCNSGWHSAKSSKTPQVKMGGSRNSKGVKKDPAEIFIAQCKYSKGQSVMEKEKLIVKGAFNNLANDDLKKAVAEYALDLITTNMGGFLQMRIVRAFSSASANNVENITKNAKKLILDWMDINEQCGIIKALCGINRAEREDIVGDVKKLTPTYDKKGTANIPDLIESKERMLVLQLLLELPMDHSQTKADKILGKSKAESILGTAVENERKNFIAYALKFITEKGLQTNERIRLLELLSRAPEKNRQEISTNFSESIHIYLEEASTLTPRSRKGEFFEFIEKIKKSLEKLNEKENNDCKEIVHDKKNIFKTLNRKSKILVKNIKDKYNNVNNTNEHSN